MRFARVTLAAAGERPVVFGEGEPQGRTVVSADTGFGTLLAATRADGPSVVLVRRPSDRSARQVLALILANLDAAADVLADGAIVVLEAERVRVRRLPLY